LDEIQGVVANTQNLFCRGAVGFMDWLGVCCIRTVALFLPRDLLKAPRAAVAAAGNYQSSAEHKSGASK